MWINIDKIGIIVTNQITNFIFIFYFFHNIFHDLYNMGYFCIRWSICYTNNNVFIFNELCPVYLNKQWFTTFIEYVEVISFRVVQVIA